MAYNIKSVQDRFAVMSGEKRALTKKGPPFSQWKPTLTEDGRPRTYNVRFLPYQDQNGQPFQEVAYYDNRSLSPFRLVAPAQFGLPDPIADLVTELRKQRSDKNTWPVIRGLLSKPRYFAPVLVREEASKGVQIWEISPTICKEIYSILVSPDYHDEDVTSPEKGYDFQVTVSPSGKTFTQPETGKTFPVNDVKIIARTKPSKLAASPEEVQKLIDSIPNLQEFFTKQVKSRDELEGILESYLSAGAKKDSDGDEIGLSHGVSDPAAIKSVEEQFEGL